MKGRENGTSDEKVQFVQFLQSHDMDLAQYTLKRERILALE
jgi:hypothetical protein